MPSISYDGEVEFDWDDLSDKEAIQLFVDFLRHSATESQRQDFATEAVENCDKDEVEDLIDCLQTAHRKKYES